MFFFVICFATILFMEPFENWKFVPEILHEEFHSKQDQNPTLTAFMNKFVTFGPTRLAAAS